MSDKQQLIGAQNVQYDYREQNPQYEGEPLNPEMKLGPVESRGCRDIFWCILYLITLAGLAITAIYSFKNGKPDQLLAPFDYLGNQCGFGTQSNFPTVYIVDANSFYCVSECPSVVNQPVKCGEGNCPQAQYGSMQMLTVCFPDSNTTDQIRQKISSIVGLADSQQVIADLKNSWPVQLITAFVALIIALLVTVVIRYAASCLVWCVILLYFTLLTLLGYFLYETGTNPEWQNLSISNNHELLRNLAYAVWGFDALSLLIFVCLIKRITLAIAVMKAAADFTRQVCEASIVPLFMFVVMCLFFAFWLTTSIYLVSCGEITANPKSPSPYGQVKMDKSIGWLLFYDLFVLYWNCNFAMAFSQFVIGSSCCMWYYSHMGADLSHPVSKSVVRGLFHHSGSLALGSLILAFIGIVRFCFDQIHKAFKETTLQKHHGLAEGCTKCWFNYCTCCLAYFEKFIRFISQNAYLMIALSGDSFCEAAHEAFYLILRNAGRIAVTHGLGEIFTTLGNMFIGISSTMIGYVILTQIDYFADQIVSPIIPTFGFLIISLVIGSLFMNVYGMAIDAILLCYIVDSELNRSQGGAKSVPPSLQEFLNEYK